MTLQTAEELLNLWIAADKAVALGQSYKVGSREVTRADADIITEKINYYSSIVRALSAPPSPRARTVVY
ncbi:DUF6148 family protein [Limisalsivibrio acetivorans]|uniref:DUF6148 family protein n=1 Tax=Limisalsivibrio acetivorans TaxID=1304888 RepID=UPI0003B7462A|nr:DUF6148 family protein [Limisalsivibrio acetivorans]